MSKRCGAGSSAPLLLSTDPLLSHCQTVQVDAEWLHEPYSRYNTFFM